MLGSLRMSQTASRKERRIPAPTPLTRKKPVGNLHFIAFHWVAVEIVVVTPTAGIPFSTSRSWCTWLVGGGDARRMPVRLCWRVCLGWGLGAGRLVRRWRMDWRTFHWRFLASHQRDAEVTLVGDGQLGGVKMGTRRRCFTYFQGQRREWLRR